MKSILLFSTILLSAGFISCNKGAGEGGTSTITGTVWAIDLNGSGDTIAQYNAADQDVYVIYGEDTKTYSDKFSTSHDGSYQFTHLRTGKYTLFTYSKCDLCPSGQSVIQKTIDITDKKQVINVENLVIFE